MKTTKRLQVIFGQDIGMIRPLLEGEFESEKKFEETVMYLAHECKLLHDYRSESNEPTSYFDFTVYEVVLSRNNVGATLTLDVTDDFERTAGKNLSFNEFKKELRFRVIRELEGQAEEDRQYPLTAEGFLKAMKYLNETKNELNKDIDEFLKEKTSQNM